jgi:hypothetical protein
MSNLECNSKKKKGRNIDMGRKTSKQQGAKRYLGKGTT